MPSVLLLAAATILLSSAIWNSVGYLITTWAVKSSEAEQKGMEIKEKLLASINVGATVQ
jgi:hypothetical protein